MQMTNEFDRNEDKQNKNKDYHIPVLLLPNTRDILNEFNSSIERVVASGSRSSTNTMTKNDDYGFQVDESHSSTVSLDYTRNVDSNGQVINPITDKKAEKINKEIHRSLKIVKKDRKNITYDIPISRLIIEIDDDDDVLYYKYGDEDSVQYGESFFFDFELCNISKFSGNIKEIVEPMFKKRNLPKQGFNWRIPVLKKIIPKQGFDFVGENHQPVFSWDPDNVNTKPLTVTSSQKITGILPKKIRHSKKVEKDSENYWVI